MKLLKVENKLVQKICINIVVVFNKHKELLQSWQYKC